MIVGIDHIALASANFDNDCGMLESKGFTALFKHRDIANPWAKNKLMQNYSPLQSIALFKKQGSLNIEIISDSTGIKGLSKLKPLCYSESCFSEINFEADFIINSFKVFVHNMDLAINQWQALGFKELSRTENSARLMFQSFATEYICVIELDGGIGEKYLDNEGFVCTAFVSTSITKDYGTLLSVGFELTEIFSIDINDKRLSIFYAQGANGEIFEVIGNV